VRNEAEPSRTAVWEAGRLKREDNMNQVKLITCALIVGVTAVVGCLAEDGAEEDVYEDTECDTDECDDSCGECEDGSQCIEGQCVPDEVEEAEEEEAEEEEETEDMLCTNTCRWAGDGECDDGGPRSLYSVCDYGSDCDDCGPRSESDRPTTGSGSGSGSGGCSLTCSSDSFTYSCATGSSTTNYSYCSNGNVSSVRVSYTNGHTVTCTLSCSGWGGTCRDDTGQSCSL